MKVELVNKEQVSEMETLAGWMGSVSSGYSGDYTKVAKHCIESGHLSVTRPCLFIFKIEEVSRAFSHQFVRENVGVYPVQESQRYVKMDKPYYVVPKSIEDNIIMYDRFDQLMERCWKFYREAVEAGVPAEDARFAIPNAAITKLHVAVSLEALIRIASKRLCRRAQWEIRAVVEEMANQVSEVSPYLSSLLQCKCDATGYCVEKNCCGKRPTKEKFMATYERGRFTEDGN